MIPNTSKQILVTEDWKKIYQSFSNVDFKSYDFDTLKRTMISYLQENYPEDFNDYIDSSEYIALIDLIAFLGQNLSFRIDLNARENFLETAERRDSILRLAQLVSYNPKRNIPASGFLKITAVTTSENIFDSNGINLANTTIAWNDGTNADWYQQFINVINSALSNKFGVPQNRKVIDSILTEQYTFNSTNEDTPIFSFSKNINGESMPFEVVPCTFADKDYVYESSPKPNLPFSIIYKDDKQGSASINTGFFVHFKQGTLNSSVFSIDNPVPNEIIGINVGNINDTDIWLWQLDKNNNFDSLWTKLQTISNGDVNVIYNAISKNIKTIYSVTSRANDQIDLNFADGVFGNLPKGTFRLFYRQSNGKTYVIKPEQMNNIIITIPYVNSSGQTNTLQLTLALQYTVANSSGPESNLSIQVNAPQNYYLQNRLITGEDYNIGPLMLGNDILKSKSINRISSGVSRFFDISDVSGRYSSTDIFADDGILYKEEKEEFFNFEFTNRNQIVSVIKNSLLPVINQQGLKLFYYSKFAKINVIAENFNWVRLNKTIDQSRGYIQNNLGPQSVGIFSGNDLKFLKSGCLIKFVAPTGKYFDKNNNLKSTPASGVPFDGKVYIWANIFQIIGDGANGGAGALSDNTGPIILSINIPTGAILSDIIPKYNSNFNFSLENEIANICLTQKNFGITINNLTREWDIILNSNLNLVSNFSLSNQYNNENLGLDASWLIAFIWDGKKYTVKYRTVEYIFESQNKTAFYIDKNSINFDYTLNTVIKDKIEILSINSSPSQNQALGVNYNWQIDNNIIEEDGYINPKKIKISFYDFNNSGQIDDPDSFDIIVGPDILNATGYKDKFLFFKKADLTYEYVDSENIISFPTESSFYLNLIDPSTVEDNSLYYFYENPGVVKYWSTATGSLVYTDEYIGRQGRSNIKFHYAHNADSQRRIDPSKTNIIDIYILSRSYDSEFRLWLTTDNTDSMPIPPTSQSLEQNFKEKINAIKSISDEVIFHPVKYKILFGDKADNSLQVTFKAVKNTNSVINDSNLKSRIYESILEFFDIENWEFGQSFYFSELSAYVMNKLTPDITNFVIVSKYNYDFGSMFEISCLADEIFITSLKINDIEIINSLSSTQLKLT